MIDGKLVGMHAMSPYDDERSRYPGLFIPRCLLLPAYICSAQF